MSLGRTHAVAVHGVSGTLVEIEADCAAGLPSFTIGGMPDAACAQSPARVRAAVVNSDLSMPQQRLVVNLSPASLPKQGAGFDLGIAVAVLAAAGTVPAAQVSRVAHLGELGLDGRVRPVPGVLPAVLAAAAAGVRTVAVPAANAAEAALVEQVEVVAVGTLADLVRRYRALGKGKPVPVVPIEPPLSESSGTLPDLADVAGQGEAREALELAAAGGHHLAMVGPPGAGKSMLAERLPGLLPPLDRQQALEATAVHSVLGELGERHLIDRPPLVAPHHGTSMAAMVGGGSGRIRPGAISRADHGVLFLDEAPEFRRDVLDALRQPLESGRVVVARGDRMVAFPARFQLVLAANPCRCGAHHGHGSGCSCSPMMRRTYLAKLSGPLMDRIDLQLTVRAVSRAAISGEGGEASAPVAARVALARDRQRRRWADQPWVLNAHAPGSVLRSQRWRPSAAHTRILDRALERGQVTLRGYDRVLRVAWTAADLAGVERPGADQIAQALALRERTQVAA